MGHFLKSSTGVALIGALLFLTTTAALLRPGQLELPVPAAEGPREANDDPSWNFKNPELQQWIEEIKREKDNLAQRAQQLQELQKRLDAEREEILAVTQAVHQLQMDFDKDVVRVKAQEMDNLKRETKIVSSMSPEGAAAMLNEMPENQTLAVLCMIKPDIASPILDTMSKMGTAEAKRAAELTARMQRVLLPAAATAKPSNPAK